MKNSTYSKEFREEAIRLSDEIGNKKAAAQLGILYIGRLAQPEQT